MKADFCWCQEFSRFLPKVEKQERTKMHGKVKRGKKSKDYWTREETEGPESTKHVHVYLTRDKIRWDFNHAFGDVSCWLFDFSFAQNIERHFEEKRVFSWIFMNWLTFTTAGCISMKTRRTERSPWRTRNYGNRLQDVTPTIKNNHFSDYIGEIWIKMFLFEMKTAP